MRLRLSRRIWVMLLLAALVSAHAMVLHHLTSRQAWTLGLGLLLGDPAASAVLFVRGSIDHGSGSVNQ